MERMNKKFIDGIQRNSNNARKVFGYADFRRMRNKKHESKIKNHGKISNFKIQILNKIQNIKSKVKNLFSINLKKIFIRKSLFRKAMALMVIVSVLATAYFHNIPLSLGETSAWEQLSWGTTPPVSSETCIAAGGTWINSECVASDSSPNNKTGWDTYSTKTNTTADTDVTLAENNGTQFTETFTGTTYKDSDNTDADWSGGNVQMPAEVNGTNLYEKLNGVLGGAQINAQVKVGNDIYVGADGGKFLKYNIISETATNLTANISSWSTGNIHSMIFDSANNMIYLGGAATKFAKYNIITDTVTSLTTKISSLWSADINVLTFDSANSVVYLGGQVGKFAKYTIGTDTASNLTSTISSFFTTAIRSLAFDSINSVIYIGGDSGKFAKYTIGTDTGDDLTSKISSFWSTSTIYSLAFDSTNSVVYIGGQSGKFAKYTIGTDTGADLTSKISSFWSTSTIYSLAFDSTNSVVYIGGQSGKFAKYTIGSDTATDLISKLNEISWNEQVILSMVSVPNGDVYIGGSSGGFAKYVPSTGIASLISLSTPSWSTNSVNAMVFDNSSLIYLAGESGKFASYNINTGIVSSAISLAGASWSTTSINDLLYDGSTGIYLGGLSGKFAKYTIGVSAVALDLSGASWGINAIQDLEFNQNKSIIFLAGFNRKLAKYTISSGVAESIDLSGVPWISSDHVRALTFDSNNNVLYVGGDSYGKLAKYDGSSVTSVDFSGTWGTSQFHVLTFDASSGTIYLGGASGRFAKYKISTNTFTYLRSSPDTISFWGTKAIGDSVSNGFAGHALIIGTNGNLYLGGQTGYFAEKELLPSSTSAVSIGIEDSFSDNIRYATLTKNDTVGTGTIAYYLSNDGGANWESVTPGVEHTFSTTGSDLRFKITVSDNATVQDITVNYWSYHTSGTLTSSAYDSGSDGNLMGGLVWNEDASLPAGTGVTVSLRTASTQGGLTGASWTDFTNVTSNCSKPPASTTVTCSNAAIPDGMKDGSGDRWYQYKIALTSTGANTPTLSDTTVRYVVNTSPSIIINPLIPATQNPDGTISINYALSDSDETSFTVSAYADIGITLNETLDSTDATITLSSTTLLPTSGTIQIDNEQISYTGKSGNDITGCSRGVNVEYSNAASHSSGAVIWAKATTATGDIGNNQTAGTGKTITWTINTDYDGVYRNASQGKIRVSADDKNIANQVGYGNSLPFAIDTKNPVPADPAVVVDASADPLAEITLSASDDSSMQMKVALSEEALASTDWETYSTSKILDLVEEPERVYAQFKDAYENTSTIVSNITPPTPTQAMVQDNSNTSTSPPEYRLFISWQTIAEDEMENEFAQYNILRSEDDVLYSTLTTITDRETNFYVDESVAYNTDYYYKISSQDVDGNISYLSTAQGAGSSAHGKANGVQDAGEGSAALTTITMLYNEGDEAGDPKVLTDVKAVIAFNTDQLAKCTIEYGTESGNYTEVPVSELSYNVNHSMHLTGLIFDTQYFYQITCEDLLENTLSGDEYDFTTLEEQMTEGEAGALSDGTAPEISGVGATAITGESALIEWTTDENANSIVNYGVASGTYENGGSNYLINSSAAEYLTSHEVAIRGLVPGTKYYYTVISIDAGGNIGESSEQTFTTKDPPKFNSISVESDNLGEVIIKWLTDEKMSSLVDYGLTTSYGDTKESSSKSLEHSLTLSGLKTSELYHFRLRGENADSNLFASADYTFTPKSPPKISNIKIEPVSEHSMKVSFNTDIPADTLITYADISNTDNAGSQGNPALVSTHEIELKDLTPGTTYNMIIRAKDEQGNETEDATQKFTTGKDENPPVIEKIRTESALAQSDKVQSIIHWTTDEPATTSLIYKEGQAGQEKEIISSINYNLEHVVVITAFKPGTVYYFKVKSIDAAKNEAVSNEHAVLTPQRKENIIQIIINNFQEIFGWAKF